MDKLDLRIEPVELSPILTCEIGEKVNQHARATVSGFVKGEDHVLLSQLYHKEFTIRLGLEDGSERYLFRGIAEEAEIREEGGVKRLTVKAASHTAKLDIEKNLRVFQDTEKTCQMVTDYIISRYKEKIGVIYEPKARETVRQELIVQYRETDWAFLKRLAAKLGLVLVADHHNAYPCFYFGLPDRDWIDLGDHLDYEVSYPGHRKEDAGYEVQYGELLDLCAKVRFLGRRLRIYQKRILLSGGALTCSYTLRREEGFRQEPYENEGLIGCSLTGKVRSVEHDVVRIGMDCEDIRGSNSKAYPYATVYSSPDGTGWYCMPEERDTVRLYFPDADADDAYVASAVHLGVVDDKRRDPEKKSIRTIHDKEVRFTPDQICITNHKGMWILLDDEKGIQIKSKKQIALTATDGISLTSGGPILVEGEDGIILKEKENSLLIRDGIRQNGMDIQFK